jgi:hypothetical protein
MVDHRGMREAWSLLLRSLESPLAKLAADSKIDSPRGSFQLVNRCAAESMLRRPTGRAIVSVMNVSIGKCIARMSDIPPTPQNDTFANNQLFQLLTILSSAK